ncbi:MAG TPA: hypothetical protein VHB27_12045 [Rhodopila sp.]|uniref:hypothetical protein n=1 Tax=Rhodopila sp. TaxID=2480087 RepID=UPI002B6A9754|nr:hypothetical protein [Rhodopila sp.]HVY15952.1 hypothetical protein [Rhodopila sp.]HWB98027.1 hypothetical protein [Bryobacteraceae bacterium]
MLQGKHDHSPPTRRFAMRFSLAALTAGLTGPAVAGPATAEALPASSATDAELLALADEFHHLTGRIHAWNAGEIDSEEGEAANADWWDCMREMIDIPATSHQGLKAKARSALEALELVADSQHSGEDLARAVLAQMAQVQA